MTESSVPAGQRGTGSVRVEFPARLRDIAGRTTDETVAGVALVILDRPRALNALSFELLADLAAVMDVLDGDPAVRAVVITGAGTRAFAIGADIAELAVQSPGSLPDAAFAGWDRVAAVGLPTIAAVRGWCLGGGLELALACDLVVAGDDAKFGQPEVSLGIIPGSGGTQRLTRTIGRARALDLILTARTIDAPEAEYLGLVTRVVPAPRTLGAALELAGEIAGQPAGAVRAAKAAVRAALELPLAEGIRRERELFRGLFGTPDQAEGMRAFLEKRTPRWPNR